jgi:hypothetical protein
MGVEGVEGVEPLYMVLYTCSSVHVSVHICKQSATYNKTDGNN